MERFALALLVVLCPAATLAQPAFVHPESSDSLSDRWNWAVDQGRGQDGYWIGYSIEKLMRPNSYIGAFGSRHSAGQTSLYALLERPEAEELASKPLSSRVHGRFWNGGQGMFSVGEDHPDAVLELKEIGILFYYERNADAPAKVRVSNLSLPVDLEERPLYWLGGSDRTESIDRLQTLYSRMSDDKMREKGLLAVGIHEAGPGILDFLTGVLRGESSSELREEAAYWIGQQDNEEALGILRETIDVDPSADVRKKAVFSASQMTLPGAVDLLIELARTKTQPELRKEAIFWLGQKASRRAAETLQEVVYDDADVQVQEHAVFALSQLPADRAVPELIEIATNHPHVSVRKKAIFWLGETGDPRAVDLLISLIER